jgi:hypothetical protein
MSDSDPMIDDDGPQRDPNDPGEVPTAFATKGAGWSGRDTPSDDDDDSED